MSMLAPIQGVGLKEMRYRVWNQQVDLVGSTAWSSPNPLAINDTTAASTTATSYTQVKSYSIGIPNNDFGRTVINAIRVQIQGYVSAGTGYVEVLINGAAPTILKTIVGTGNSNSFTNTSSALVFDGIISLLGVSNPYTLSIDAYNSTSGDTTYIADVYGFQGLAITSTTAVTIDQQETTPSNTILDEIGISYSAASGLNLAAYAIRYTTATATISGVDQFTPSGKTSEELSIPAANDSVNNPQWYYNSVNNSNDSVPTGYNGSYTYTVTANVGASGDIIIIGSLRAWFSPTALFFPKGPHIGFMQATLDIINYVAGIYILMNDYRVPWSGSIGNENTIASFSVSGYTSGESASGWFVADETTQLYASFPGRLIFWQFLIEVIN